MPGYHYHRPPQAGMVAGGGRPARQLHGHRLRRLPAGLFDNMEDEPVDKPASVEQNMDEPEWETL